jgi:hypothetical protein
MDKQMHTRQLLQHWLNIVRNLEWSFRLRFDLLDRHTIRQLDQGQAISKVDIKHALD